MLCFQEHLNSRDGMSNYSLSLADELLQLEFEFINIAASLKFEVELPQNS